MAGRRPRRRCRYYVNTNFFVDLEDSRREAIEFALRHRGMLCTSKLLIREYAAVNKQATARLLARSYGIRVYSVGVLRLLKRAKSLLQKWGVAALSDNTVVDVAHILAAKELGARYFVTSDSQACKKAIRLGLYCINHRTGEEYAPS
ncbi:hypothetical protein [Pyrodictium abyssi]|uniref:PIN domain-containing protein n=1 Tax=Pyrodictium abyssi TaxID=54256 RepID=A0ABM8J105_9CREN|nr:hypothetical protein PABY_23190 [Pyrodictium abyssi]